MIKFFRKIRQKLLSENKFNKYLIYAIGEIILVVIGILIALQVNNLNERRIASDQSKTYLKNLDAEINQNILIIESVGENLQSLADISHYYHSKLFDISTEVNDTVISNFILKINPIVTFNPSQTVLKDFISSGYLKDIKDEKLKNDILLLESRYQSINDLYEEINNQYNNHIQPYLMTHGDYTMIVDSIYQYKVRKAEFGHSREAFLNNKTLSNQLIWYYAFLGEAKEITTGRRIKRFRRLSDDIKEYLQN